jgi:hypothetical protein
MKKTVLFLVVFVLLIGFVQVALANPDSPNIPETGGACHMDASWWEAGEGPGNANGVKPGERGMRHVHTRDDHPRGYTNGAANMDKIYEAHGCLG